MDLIGKLKFAEQDPKWAEEKAFYLSYQPPPGSPDTNVVYEAVDLLIHDIRPFKDSLSITREGYQIVDLESKLNYEDFFDRNRVQDVFLPELRTVLMELFGARGIYFHETVIRSRHPQFPSDKTITGHKYEQPIPKAHIDYSLDQLRRLLEDVSGTTIPSGTRIQAVNVWKPLKGPVRDWPLAYCDVTTLDKKKDLLELDSVFAHGFIEGYTVHYNPNQRWNYLSNQMPSELLVFNTADSGQCGPVAHCAFQNPQASLDADLRESIEFRVFVLY